MPDIHFECPKCKRRLDASEELAAQLIDCPTCNETIEVPVRSRRVEPPKSPSPEPAPKNSGDGGRMAVLLLALAVSLAMVIYYYTRRATVARELNALMANSSSFKNQIGAFEKGQDEARKNDEWLARLTNKQETLIDKSDQAVEALKRHAAAVTELDDATKATALSQVDLDEKTGNISSAEAAKRRGEIEKADLIKKAADKQKLLDDIAAQLSADSVVAKKEEADAQAAYKAALGKTPFGKLNNDQKRRVSDLIAMETDNANPNLDMKDKHDPNLINRIHASLSPQEKTAYESQLRVAKLAAIQKEEEELKAELKSKTRR